MEEVTAYKVNRKVYETEKEAERAQALKELEEIINEIHYYGINEDGIRDGLLEFKGSLQDIFNRL